MMRWILLVSWGMGAVLGSGCVHPRQPFESSHPTLSESEALFDAGLEDLAASGDASTLTSLVHQYPGGIWAARAQKLAVLVEQLDRSLTRNDTEVADLEARFGRETKRLERELARCHEDSDPLRQERELLKAQVTASRTETERLQDQIARLQADLAQLKKLIIEGELRR